MPFKITAIDAALLLGTVQGFILSLLLLLKPKGNRTANRILAAILGLISASILLHVLSQTAVPALDGVHIPIIAGFMILVGPLIWLYSRGMTRSGFSLGRRPGLGFALLAALLAAGLPPALGVFSAPLRRGAEALFKAGGFAVMALFLGLANRVLWRYARSLRSRFSTLDKIHLLWLRFFIIGLTLFWLGGGLVDLLGTGISWDFVWLASCGIIYLIGYFGFGHPDVFAAPAMVKAEIAEKDNRKYGKSSLTRELADAYLEKLRSLMQGQKVYLDTDLSLASLAQALGISLHHLSQILNERLGRNFYDYINAQRIAEAERLLKTPEGRSMTISAIAFAVGFNTLSAFNSAFKKFAGSTPSRFRDRPESGAGA